MGWIVCGVLGIGFAVGAVQMANEAGTERGYLAAPVCNVPNVLDPTASPGCTRGDRTVETVAEIGSQTVVRQVGKRRSDSRPAVPVAAHAPGGRALGVSELLHAEPPTPGIAAPAELSSADAARAGRTNVA